MIKLGIIGFGNIAQEYYSAIEKVEDLKLISVMESNKEKVEIVKNLGLRFYNTGDKKFYAGIDCVVIATPPYLHAAQTIESLQNGKDVLCEKPMATNLKDANEMIKYAEKTKRNLMIASHANYNPGIQSLIQNPNQIGKIGKIQASFLEDVTNYTPNENWLYKKSQSGGGCLIDSGINALDCLRKILGKLNITNVDLQYWDKNKSKKLNIETTAQIDFTFEKNFPGRLNISWISNKEKREIIFFTDSGKYKIDWINPEMQGAQTDMSEEYFNLIKDFNRKIKQKEKYIDKEGLKSLELVLECYKLADKNF